MSTTTPGKRIGAPGSVVLAAAARHHPMDAAIGLQQPVFRLVGVAIREGTADARLDLRPVVRVQRGQQRSDRQALHQHRRIHREQPRMPASAVTRSLATSQLKVPTISAALSASRSRSSLIRSASSVRLMDSISVQVPNQRSMRPCSSRSGRRGRGSSDIRHRHGAAGIRPRRARRSPANAASAPRRAPGPRGGTCRSSLRHRSSRAARR